VDLPVQEKSTFIRCINRLEEHQAAVRSIVDDVRSLLTNVTQIDTVRKEVAHGVSALFNLFFRT